MSRKPVKFGIFGPMYPPMDACIAAIPRAEKLGWDFATILINLSTRIRRARASPGAGRRGWAANH